MPPKENKPYVNTHIIPTPGQTTIKKSIPLKTTQISPPIIVITPNLPNTTPTPIITPITQPQQIIIPNSTPLSNNHNITLSNLPNTTSEHIQDNTYTYVLIGAVIVGFIILSNKDI